MFETNQLVNYVDFAGNLVVAQVEYFYTDEGWELVKMRNGDVLPADCVSALETENA